jgi:NAD(P)H-hydrate epimerase
MARLLGITPPAVQRDRIACARDLAAGLNLHVVLKGARSIIAHPDGTIYVNPTGNPGMASGGMGDVLTGAIAGLITQGIRPELAARAGVFLHGAAADSLARSLGPWGYLASEVMNALPSEIAKRLKED